MKYGWLSSTHTIALTPRQYRSHIPRKRGWPPRSQNLIVTFPLFTLRMLKPTVGIVSSVNSPTCGGPSHAATHHARSGVHVARRG